MNVIWQIARRGWGRSRRARHRVKWDEATFWFRLRYPDAEQVQRALNLVSRHTDRIGLRLRVQDGVTQLCIGVSADAVARVLEEMARDIGFRLTATGNSPPPLTGSFTPAQHLVEETLLGEAVDAYLVRERLFTLSDAKPREKGLVFPDAAALNGKGHAPGHGPGTWEMPTPILGIAIQPKWSASTPSELVLEDEADWVLGQSPDGLTLGGRCVQVFGDDSSSAEWLAQLVLTRLARKPVGLVVIDGRGDLVPRLLSDPSIARLRSAKQVTYLAVNVAGQGGVNPLASVPDEDLAQVQERWHWWFAGMGVARQSLDLLPMAIEAGVTDLPALQRWLKGRNGNSFAAAVSFRAVLDQLMRNHVVYRWFTLYPVELQATLKNGALFISCPHKGSWSRLQAIRAALGLVAKPETDFVLHHVQLDERDFDRVKLPRIVINTNTPNPTTTTILTRVDDFSIEKAAAAFQSPLSWDMPKQAGPPANHTRAMMTEHIQCLRGGEALVVRSGCIGWCSFRVGVAKDEVGVVKEGDR